jgi:hypothetical protein
MLQYPVLRRSIAAHGEKTIIISDGKFKEETND